MVEILDEDASDKSPVQIEFEKTIHNWHLGYRDSDRGIERSGRYPAHWTPTKVDSAAAKRGRLQRFFEERRNARSSGQPKEEH